MANDLVPQPKRPGTNGNGNGNGNGHNRPLHVLPANQVYDPLVPLEFVDTDAQTADTEWDLPPVATTPRLRRQSFQQSRERAEEAEAEAKAARRRGHDDFAAVREIDAAEMRQGLMDWGDFKTWAIIFAMFFGFLLFVAFVYSMPQGRHNQSDGPAPVPGFRGY